MIVAESSYMTARLLTVRSEMDVEVKEALQPMEAGECILLRFRPNRPAGNYPTNDPPPRCMGRRVPLLHWLTGQAWTDWQGRHWPTDIDSVSTWWRLDSTKEIFSGTMHFVISASGKLLFFLAFVVRCIHYFRKKIKFSNRTPSR